MKAATILWVGRSVTSSIASSVEKQFNLVTATSGKTACQLLQERTFDGIILDSVSMRTPGERICATLRQAAPSIPLVHLHPGPAGDATSAADVVIVAPITPRKVTKTLERLLSEQDEGMLCYGPFAMSLKRGTLIVNGLETPLTPKQAALIEVFLLNPGEVLSRKVLMEKVWQTDYMGDTRTLNVHIRWIRQTIEPNPSQPRYLQTVRGIGYCLSVSDEEAELNEADEPETPHT